MLGEITGQYTKENKENIQGEITGYYTKENMQGEITGHYSQKNMKGEITGKYSKDKMQGEITGHYSQRKMQGEITGQRSKENMQGEIKGQYSKDRTQVGGQVYPKLQDSGCESCLSCHTRPGYPMVQDTALYTKLRLLFQGKNVGMRTGTDPLMCIRNDGIPDPNPIFQVIPYAELRIRS